jgi:hypothetical protein
MKGKVEATENVTIVQTSEPCCVTELIENIVAQAQLDGCIVNIVTIFPPSIAEEDIEITKGCLPKAADCPKNN